MSNHVTLANWRTAPHNVWAFGNVDRIIPAAPIAVASPAPLATAGPLDMQGLRLAFESRPWTWDEALAATGTDGILILQGGRIVHERYVRGEASTRHILFSVSKSITGLLAGILAEDGKLDPDAPVSRYVPEIAASAYGSASVRHVLDMTVDVTFVEDYLDARGAFARYRVATGWNPPNPEFGDIGLHAFLATVPRGDGEHGTRFHYVSPNSDLLGWILERAGDEPLAAQIARRIWQPMGAEWSAYVTVDRFGAPRAAGGICTTLRDLARLGEMVRRGGLANGRQIVPSGWIADMWRNGDAAAWQRGEMTSMLPQGRYRSQWYVTDNRATALCAIGIHGQWIYVRPDCDMVIVKQSSQKEPLDPRIDALTLALFEAVTSSVKAG